MANAIVTIIYISTFLLGAEQNSSSYVWPLDLPREITSSFAEFRSGRFHAGIDLRTGPVGKPVRSAADGYVARIRSAPTGYGKAVYVQQHDGYTFVYAHLQRFRDDLDTYVREAHHARESLTVDLTPEPGQFPVRRGEVIAYSGSSGTTAPHLHYEPRDSANRPINPRLIGLDWPDERSPVPSAVLVAPRNALARVNGDYIPAVLPLTRDSGGTYRTQPVHISGEVGFGVDVIDPGEKGSKLDIYIGRVLHGDKELYRIQKDILSYDHIPHGAVAWFPWMKDQGRFKLLWRWSGNEADAYNVHPNEGWFSGVDQKTDITLVLEDFHHNTAKIIVPVLPEKTTPSAPPVDTPTGSGTVEYVCKGTYLVITATFDQDEPDTPRLQVDGDAASLRDTVLGEFIRIDNRTFRAAWGAGPASQWIQMAVEHPRVIRDPIEIAVFPAGRGGEVRLGDIEVKVPGTAPYGVMYAWTHTLPQASARGLRAIGPRYEIAPSELPFKGSIEVRLPAPEEDDPRLAVYRWTGSRWTRQQTQRRQDQLIFSTGSLGIFAAMIDETPPVIEISSPADAVETSPLPNIRARVSDAGSGISSVDVRANGQWLLIDYNPFSGDIVWEKDKPLPVGRVEIQFTVTDNAGNVTTAIRTIQVRATS